MTLSGPDASGATTGIPAVGQHVEERLRRRRNRVADEPERLDPSRPQPDRIAEQPDRSRADRRTDLGVHLGHRPADDVEHGVGRDPTTVDERRLDPTPLHLGGDLGPGSVDDDHLVPGAAQGMHLLRGLRGHAAAELEHDPAHVVYSALIRT